MTSTTRRKRATSLNLAENGPELISIVKKECRTLTYDAKKVMALLNCTHNQAYTLITMAKIDDNMKSVTINKNKDKAA